MTGPPIVQNKDGMVPAAESLVLQTLRETLGESMVPAALAGAETPPSVPQADTDATAPVTPEKPVEKPAEKSADEDSNQGKTLFTVFAEDGKTPVTPQKMLFEFKANGKVRTEPLDRVVEFAKLGVYNHEREQRLQQAQAESQEEVESVYAELDQRDAAIERLLTDPDYFDAVARRFSQEQSPERQVSRAKAEAAELRAQVQSREVEQQGHTFFEQVVFPGIDRIMRENPEMDDPEEVAARLALMLEPLRVNGRIPANRHHQVEALMATELRDWAKATNDRRKQKYTSATAQAQAHEQRAKNAQAAVTSPASIGTAPATQARKGPLTVDEADAEILLDTIRSMRAG